MKKCRKTTCCIKSYGGNAFYGKDRELILFRSVVYILSAFILIFIFAGCRDNLAASQEKLRSADSPLIRAAAAERLGEIGGEEAIRTLTLHGVRDLSPIVRAASVKALRGKDHPQVTDLLGDLLQDPDEEVQKQAAAALALDRSRKAHRYLELGYARSGSRGRVVIGDALEKSGAELEPVIREIASRRLRRNMYALQEGSQAERIGALHDLGRSSFPEAVDVLIVHLDHQSVPVAAAAASALGEAGDIRAVPHLIGVLFERHLSLPHAALYALGNLGDSSAAAPIADLAITDSGNTARQAVGTLARFDDNETVTEAICRVAVRALIPEVAAEAVSILKARNSLDECDLSNRISDVQRDGLVRHAALAVISVAGTDLKLSEEVKNSLIMLLSHSDPVLRAEALDALVSLGVSEIAEEALEMLDVLSKKDAMARERWVSGVLPTDFSWDQSGMMAVDAHHSHGDDALEHAGLSPAERYRGRFEDLMGRVVDYRTEQESRRRKMLGLDDRDEEEIRSRLRESIFSESPAAKISLLPQISSADVRLLASLTRSAIPLSGEKALDTVIQLLEHPEPLVRNSAVKGLSHIDSDIADSALINALAEGQFGETSVLISELLAVKKKGKNEILRAIRWVEPDAARMIIHQLSVFADEDSVHLLIDLLDSPHAADAARILAVVGGEKAGIALKKHLEAIDAPGMASVLEHAQTVDFKVDLSFAAGRGLHSDWPEIRAASAGYLLKRNIDSPWLKALAADYDGRVRRALGVE